MRTCGLHRALLREGGFNEAAGIPANVSNNQGNNPAQHYSRNDDAVTVTSCCWSGVAATGLLPQPQADMHDSVHRQRSNLQLLGCSKLTQLQQPLR